MAPVPKALPATGNRNENDHFPREAASSHRGCSQTLEVYGSWPVKNNDLALGSGQSTWSSTGILEPALILLGMHSG